MSTTPSSVRCSICGANDLSPWRWEGLVSCETCGHVQQSTEDAPASGKGLQEEYFDGEFLAQADLFTRFYDALNNRRRLKEVRATLSKGRVLEVGVGRGGLLVTFRRAGFRVEGLDVSAVLSSEMGKRHGFTIHRGTLEATADAFPREEFDLLIMCHVLEHIESPILALRAARQLLRPGGVLYVAVPNRLAWAARLPGWTGYQPYHVQYFSATSLRRVMEAAGFQISFETTVEPLTGWCNAIVGSLRSRRPNLAHRPKPAGAKPKRGPAWIAYNTLRFCSGVAMTPVRWLQGAQGNGEELVIMASAKG